MAQTPIEKLAPLAVISLVLFLGFGSQWLFYHVEPQALSSAESYKFNALLAVILICYIRAWKTDVGRVPPGWKNESNSRVMNEDGSISNKMVENRFCFKCEAYKPSRAHHCKTCERCVLKMDHHCVWTANCVSHITLPHFIRFVFFAVVTMAYLESLLFARAAVLWHKRHLPSYLGPTSFQLGLMFIIITTNSFVLFALILLLGKTLWSLALNMTTIEGWEVERHHAVLRRARFMNGSLEGPDGSSVAIEHQEFPYDIGIWSNICEGMGSTNPLIWLWPFASSPSTESGLNFRHNGIDDPSKPWPPPDPDRMFRNARIKAYDERETLLPMDKASFALRQSKDLARYEDADGEYVVRRRPYNVQEPDFGHNYGRAEEHSNPYDEVHDEPSPDRKAWRNAEGERLADFGVDEVAEDDDVPLAQIKQQLDRGRQRHQS